MADKRYFGAVIDGKRVRLEKRRNVEEGRRPQLTDIAHSQAPARMATYIVDLDTGTILKDRYGELTNFDDAPVLTPRQAVALENP
jgi:hypothetical protein